MSSLFSHKTLLSGKPISYIDNNGIDKINQ